MFVCDGACALTAQDASLLSGSKFPGALARAHFLARDPDRQPGLNLSRLRSFGVKEVELEFAQWPHPTSLNTEPNQSETMEVFQASSHDRNLQFTTKKVWLVRRARAG
jgi:hypothetical protein